MMRNAAWTLPLALLAASCSNQTAGDPFQVPFSISGLQRPETGPLRFTTPLNWAVQLDAAQIYLGPFYFNIAPPEQGVYRSGVVTAESLVQVAVDTLDPSPVPVPGGVNGETGTSIGPAVAAELDLFPPDATLTGVDPDAGGPTGLGSAYLAGVASRGGVQLPFAGWIVIDSNLATIQNPLSWIQRVNGALCDLNFTTTDSLLTLQVDPTTWFDGADFSTLLPNGSPDGGAPDGGPYDWTDVSAFETAVLNGIQQTTGVYTFQLTSQ
jgi:hypothetical protein